MTVAIVTAWRDHLELCNDYFRAVEEAQPDQLVIVDDGSDPALEFAAVRLDETGGFSTANNLGLSLVECDVTLFLNNDVAPLRQGWLEDVVSLVEPKVLVAPLRFDTHGDVDGVNYPYGDGWCLAGLTQDLRDLGGWDETYDQAGPAYYSDNALSFQARLKGFRIREVRPRLRHKGGQTGGADLELFQKALAANKEIFAEQVRVALK
jgi:GT2 family glycosyltransferase